MSEVTQVNQDSNQLHNDYDLSKVFVWNNRYNKVTLSNPTGSPVEFKVGTVLAAIVGTPGLLIPFVIADLQPPIGVLAQTITIPAASTADVQMCVAGDVAEEKIILDGAEVLADAWLQQGSTTSMTVEQALNANSQGINLVEATEMTNFDNQ